MLRTTCFWADEDLFTPSEVMLKATYPLLASALQTSALGQGDGVVSVLRLL